MSRGDPLEGTPIWSVFCDVADWRGSIVPACPPDDHVPCLENHRRPSTTCCSTFQAFLRGCPGTSQSDLGSWPLNSERDGHALPQRSSRESAAVGGEMGRGGEMLATAPRYDAAPVF